MPFYKYQIIITKYTDDDTRNTSLSNVANRCEDIVEFGDNTSDTVSRSNGGNPLCPACWPCDCAHCGEMLIEEPGYRVKKNVYITEHVFPGPGSYLIRSFDPFRNKNVQNIPNSDNQPFYIESLLIITSFTGANSSPEFKYTPIDRACLGRCFYHNPGAFDPDGDSLSYELSVPRGENGSPIPGYSKPDPGPSGIFDIHPRTGLITWCKPGTVGEFNIAFIVKEWRKNTSGNYDLIGTVLRDMQVLVQPCADNQPPDILTPPDTCVTAGSLIKSLIVVKDPDTNSIVTLEGEAGAFAVTDPKATLSATSGTLNNNIQNFTSVFSWQTTCDHIRSQPYQTVFKASDNKDPKLVFFKTYTVKVVPPAIKNLKALTQGSSVMLNWDAANCNPQSNPLTGFFVYRKKGCDPVLSDPCTYGNPDTTNYKLIGTTTATVFGFTDSDKGNGLVTGQSYNYIVVARYSDGSLSFAGAGVCAELKRDVPVLTHADVLNTSRDKGKIFVSWEKPLIGPDNFDLTKFKGPYKIILMHREGNADPFTEIFSDQKTDINILGLSFTLQNCNTENSQHEFFLSFYSDTIKIGDSPKANSVFLNAQPSDRKIKLDWNARTPWDNQSFKVFRKDSGTTAFTFIGTGKGRQFTDSAGLVNLKRYVYYVETSGFYTDPLIERPLLNKSQELVTRPVDKTPPAVPQLTVTADCVSGKVLVTWNDVSKQSDDVAYYELFAKPTVNDEYQVVSKLKTGEELVFNPDALNSIAACYAVSSTDIYGNTSQLSPDFCIDNCPEFELPNVFTPNSDGVNDFFKAIKIRQVKEIYLTVTDRWGNLVYKTNNPYFEWDGISQVSKQPVSDGTFMYVCQVYEWRITGLVTRTVKGTVQVLR